MSKRFILMAVTLGLILWAAIHNLQAEEATIFHVFFWLFLVLVVAGVALWPTTGREQQAELKLERMGWADRIDFAAAKGAPATETKRSGPEHYRSEHVRAA
jgi:hypothetical protein